MRRFTMVPGEFAAPWRNQERSFPEDHGESARTSVTESIRTPMRSVPSGPHTSSCGSPPRSPASSVRCVAFVGIVALAGCKQEALDPGAWLDAPPVAAIEVVPTQGEAPLVVTVRAVDARGIPLRLATADVTVDGVPTTAESAGGYGWVILDEPGRHELETADGAWSAFVLSNNDLGLALPPVSAAPTDFRPEIVRTTEHGVLVSDGSSVWWAGPYAPSSRLLTLSGAEEVLEIQLEHVDGNGVLDVVITTTDRMLLLQGWGAGEYTWAAERVATEQTLVAALATPGDDGHGWLHLVWLLDDQGLVESFEHRSAGEFLRSAPWETLYPPTTATLADGNGDGVQELFMGGPDGIWERWQLDPEEPQLVVDPSLVFDAPPDATLLTSLDLDLDGKDEVVLASPRVEGVPRELAVLDLSGAGLSLIRREPLGAWLAVGDAGDARGEELWSLGSDGMLEVLTAVQDNMVSWTLADVPDIGPVAMSSGIGDTYPDLFLGSSERWWWLTGMPGGEDAAPWRVDHPDTTALLEDVLQLAPWPTLEEGVGFVTVQEREGARSLRAWRMEPGAIGPREHVDVDLSLATALVDVAACPSVAAALLVDRVQLVALETEDILDVPLSGSRIACLDDVVAVLEDTRILLMDLAGEELAAIAHEGARDIALVPSTTDTGLPTVWTCRSDDCRVGAWWLTPDATPTKVVAGAQGLLLDSDPTARAGGSMLSMGDLDGDGRDDLIAAWEDGWMTVQPSAGASAARPVGVHLHQTIADPPIPLDYDGDGLTDLLLRGADRKVRVTTRP